MGKAWIKARKHDRFYRAAKKQSYRSRAAIKLSQIDLRYGLFEGGDVLCGSRVAPGGPVRGESVPRGRLPRFRSSGRRALRGDERRQADGILRDQRGNLRPRGGTPLGRRGARNRSGPLQALLRFVAGAQTGKHLAPVQPRRDVFGSELRRFRVALVRVHESAHARIHDALVVPRDRVLGADMDRLVIAFEGFREQSLLEVDRAEVAPRDLVLRIQPDRVLMAAERLVEAAEVPHRDPAGRPCVRRAPDEPNRALVVRQGFLVPPLLYEVISLRYSAVRDPEEQERREHPAPGDRSEQDNREGRG